MSDILAIANLAGLFALAAFVLFRGQNAASASAAPAEIDDERLTREVGRIVRRDVSEKVLEALSEQTRRLRDESRRATRREVENMLALPEWHAKIEQLIEAKLSNGAFVAKVRELVEQEILVIKSVDDPTPKADSGVWEANPEKTEDSLLRSAARRAHKQSAERRVADDYGLLDSGT